MDKTILSRCQTAATSLWGAVTRAEELGDTVLASTLAKVAAQIPTEEGQAPPLKEGDCPNYREYGLICGRGLNHQGNCGP